MIAITSNHLEYLIIILLSKLETIGFHYIYRYRSVKMKEKNSSHLLENRAVPVTVAILQIKYRKKLYRYIDNKEREEELFVSKSSNLNMIAIASNHLEYLIIILLSKLETLGFHYIYRYRSVKIKGTKRKNSSVSVTRLQFFNVFV